MLAMIARSGYRSRSATSSVIPATGSACSNWAVAIWKSGVSHSSIGSTAGSSTLATWRRLPQRGAKAPLEHRAVRVERDGPEDRVADEATPAIEHERLGSSEHGIACGDRSVAVADVGVCDVVPLHEPPRVGREVLRVDTEHHETVRPVPAVDRLER